MNCALLTQPSPPARTTGGGDSLPPLPVTLIPESRGGVEGHARVCSARTLGPLGRRNRTKLKASAAAGIKPGPRDIPPAAVSPCKHGRQAAAPRPTPLIERGAPFFIVRWLS